MALGNFLLTNADVCKHLRDIATFDLNTDLSTFDAGGHEGSVDQPGHAFHSGPNFPNPAKGVFGAQLIAVGLVSQTLCRPVDDCQRRTQFVAGH